MVVVYVHNMEAWTWGTAMTADNSKQVADGVQKVPAGDLPIDYKWEWRNTRNEEWLLRFLINTWVDDSIIYHEGIKGWSSGMLTLTYSLELSQHAT